MPFYRFLGIDGSRRIISATASPCGGDIEAYAVAVRLLAFEAGIEVWRGRECLGIIEAAAAEPGWTGPHLPTHLWGADDRRARPIVFRQDCIGAAPAPPANDSAPGACPA